MDIFINFITLPANLNFSLKFKPTTSIEDVKYKIQEERMIPKNFQRLIFTGQILRDKYSLSSYKIEDDSILDVVLRFQDDLLINIKTTNGHTASFELLSHTLIEDVKSILQGKEGFPSLSKTLPLFFDEVKLEDRQSLSFYNIEDGSTLFLDSVTRERTRTNILIKTSSKTIAIDCNIMESVHDLKCMIEKTEKIPPFLQRLKFEGEKLDDCTSLLCRYKIKEGSILILDLYYPDEIKIFIETLTKRKKILTVKTGDTIENVKDQILLTENVSFDKYDLTFNEQKLYDSHTLFTYKIQEHSILHLKKILFKFL